MSQIERRMDRDKMLVEMVAGNRACAEVPGDQTHTAGFAVESFRPSFAAGFGVARSNRLPAPPASPVEGRKTDLRVCIDQVEVVRVLVVVRVDARLVKARINSHPGLPLTRCRLRDADPRN